MSHRLVVGSLVALLVFVSSARGQWTREQGLRLAADFELEMLYKVPESQGSWVSLTNDDRGRLIASDQYGRLYRIDVRENGTGLTVAPIHVNTGRAHGLLYAFDALYVMSHEGDGQPSGLYRVTDSDGDDQFDRVELLRQINGSGEHGPHAIVLSPDKKSLYICAGNHTQLPEVTRSRVPLHWNEDQLLPRMWDAGGHAVGILAPGGWIIKSDPDAREFELISSGYRNQYDIGFDQNGELFTFDADMEWDVGLPWYRPTRICHAVSGSEFGWRSGSGKWPTYYPDSLPAAVDIGTASPTGVEFGTGAKFPAKYQRALFAADWSYGIIYAVHLSPSGASFGGEREVFCTAPGLAVTDLVIRPDDGSMYFLIGGRKSQSALFRISYGGNESTKPAELIEPTEAALIRKHLEGLHALSESEAARVVDEAWPYLENADRFVRFAARIAIERMPEEVWTERVFKENRGQAILEAGTALARCGVPKDQPRLVEKLLSISWDELSSDQRLHLLRNLGLAIIRMGEPNSNVRQMMLERFEAIFPTGDDFTDREICRLLVALESGRAATVGVELMTSGRNQEEQIHYAYCLRPLRSGWTPELRQRYFEWFLTTGEFKGGNSFAKFLENIRAEASVVLTDFERRQFASLVTRPVPRSEPKLPEATRPIVKVWEMQDFSGVESDPLDGRNTKNGEAMFIVGQCYKCHQIAGSGGSVGPDLTPAGRRFNNHDLLQTLIDPSKEVSDQYRATTFLLNDGRVVTGRIANLNGDTYMIQTNMLDPGNLTQIKVQDIEDQKPSDVSMMPKNLLDTMSNDDVMDLLAYLREASEANMQKVD